MIALDAATTAGAANSIRALGLYGCVFAGTMFSIFWKQEIGLYLLTVLLPLQTTRYHLHPFPLGANIVDILLLAAIIGALLRPAPPLARTSGVTGLLLFLGLFYYLSLWRGAFYLGAPMPLWFDNERLVDYKNIMVMPLLTLAVTLIVRTRRQIAIILLLCGLTAAAVDLSYLKSAAGRDFGHYSEEARDAGPLGYAGENGLASYVLEITACLLPLLALKDLYMVKAPLLLVLAANICCILFSYSREAYLALAAVFCFVALLRLRWLLVPLFLVAVGWQAVLPTAVQERVTMTYTRADEGQRAQLDASAQERLRLWNDSMSLFRENPIFGTGFLTYARMNRVEPYRDTHNFYLKVLVETGLIGLLLFLIQLLFFIREGVLLFRKAKDSFLSLFGLGFASLMLGAAIVNLFGDRWLFIQVDSNLWILLGCVLCAASLVQAEDSARLSHPLLARQKRIRTSLGGDAFRPPLILSSAHAEGERIDWLTPTLPTDERTCAKDAQYKP
jgi:putative inorganic carbon (hco3(-)) transporter